MAKKKIMYIVFTAIIMLLAVIPLAAMPFYENKAAEAEQRTLAPAPKLIKTDGETGKKTFNSDFGSDFEDYFQDRFAFRSEMVNAGSEIMLNVFNSSPEDDVICGKDGWLFFAETLEDYCGTESLSEAELQRLTTVIRLEKEYCEENGAAYVFTVAPNKNSIYPEFMQEHYFKGGETNLDRLNTLLCDSGITVADIKAALLAAKVGAEGADNGPALYYAYDSHWNWAGAVVACNAIMEAVNEALQGDLNYAPYSNVTYYNEAREGDLLKMVLPLDSGRAEYASKTDIEQLYRYVGRMTSLDYWRINTELKNKAAEGENTESGGLLMFRDSFGRTLIPLLSNYFDSATYLNPTPFDIYGNIEGKSVVIREIVERNLDLLLERAPIVAASEAKDAASLELKRLENATVISESASKDKLNHVYGFAVNGNAAGENYRVFALVDGKYYEGFPVYENTLVENYGSCGNDRAGFSFYFESEALPQGAEVELFYTVERSGDK